MATVRPQQKQRQGQNQRRRVLRVGVILGGKIVEERLLREHKDVTIGQSAKNTFSVPVEGLPRSWSLFIAHEETYHLQFAENMDGRLSDGKGVHTLASLKSKGAQRKGNTWVVPLQDSARGKIVVGEMTLLFQFVIEPPRQPRPHLPASVRGGLADRIDPMLAIILAVSLFLHIGIALFALQYDRVIKKRTTRVFNETFVRPMQATAEQIEIPTQEPVTDGDSDEKVEDEKPAAKSEKPSGKSERPDNKSSGDDSGSRSAEERLRLQEQARRYAEDLLSDTFSEGGFGGGSSDRDARNDLAQAIDAVKNSDARVEVGGGSRRRGTRGDGSSNLGTGKGPAVEGPGGSTTKSETKKAEKVPRTRVKLGGGRSDDETSLNPDLVLRTIQRKYMTGLKRCHKKALKNDPSAGGTVALKFTVGETGRVVRVRARGFDPTVDTCIQGLAKSWRFAIPKDSDGDPTDATFEVSLALQAE